MDFNLEQEFIEQNNLSEEQVAAITNQINTGFVPEIKKEYDNIANQNAENILSGAANKVEELTGIKREQGQKIADYIDFARGKFFEGTKSDLERQKSELEQKLKESTGDQALKDKVEELNGKIDIYKQKEAQYDDLIKGGYKDKYEDLFKKTSELEISNAFNSVKPTFDKSVNTYEAKAKWGNFMNSIKETHDIKNDENGKAIAVDKENQYKVTPLDQLVKEDKELQELVTGRQQLGLGHKGKVVQLEEIPFSLPENPTSTDIQKAITDYLVGEKKLNKLSQEYSKQFAELNIKVKQKIAK